MPRRWAAANRASLLKPAEAEGCPAMGKLHLLVAALAVASPCAAQTTTDGDTPQTGRIPYRLQGVDAPAFVQNV